LTTTLKPQGWADGKLIEERKFGLSQYLNALLASPDYRTHEALVAFLSSPIDNTSAVPTSAGVSTRPQQRVLAAAGASQIAASYYPSWSVWSRPPESLDFSKFDILFFAFVMPTASNGINWGGSTDTLKRLVAAAKKSGYGTKIVLSVGGWGGCYYFSQVMSSSTNRGAFIANLASAVNTYGLAGIDIDWVNIIFLVLDLVLTVLTKEYPNSPGAGQPYSPADAANLLTFFTYLRKSLGNSAIISAAVSHLPWLGSNGQPLKDVSQYAAQMTYANIMLAFALSYLVLATD
jgi:chitinase